MIYQYISLRPQVKRKGIKMRWYKCISCHFVIINILFLSCWLALVQAETEKNIPHMLFKDARVLQIEKKFDLAFQKYQEIIEKYPNSSLIFPAIKNWKRCYLRLHPLRSSEEMETNKLIDFTGEMEKRLKGGQEREFKPLEILLIAEVCHMTFTEKYYRLLVKNYPDHPQIDYAELMLASEINFAKGKSYHDFIKLCIDDIERWVKVYPNSKLLPNALYLLAGYYESAADRGLLKITVDKLKILYSLIFNNEDSCLSLRAKSWINLKRIEHKEKFSLPYYMQDLPGKENFSLPLDVKKLERAIEKYYWDEKFDVRTIDLEKAFSDLVKSLQ